MILEGVKKRTIRFCRVPLFAAIAFVAVISACTDKESTEPPSPIVEDPEKPAVTDGFKLIGSADDSVYLGANLASVPAGDRPQMLVRFDYNFWFSKHEVTCGEYRSVMDGHGFVPECEGDSLPVADVTFYDAVLFANEKSKALGLDTAYRYTSVVKDNLGHCTFLEGYAFDPQSPGMRLPTEAEWMFVSRWHWDTQHSWNAENSENKPHNVCTALPDDAICDMAGNVMEWMNDWYANMRDTTLTNFAGAPDGGHQAKRIVKGGSFRTPAAGMLRYSRGDVYTVTSSTHAEYVGFRLAMGAIPNAVWMNDRGYAGNSRFVIVASSAKLRGKTGSYNVKLAFRNDLTGNLAFIDYSSGIPNVQEIVDDLDVYHPDISPDGKYVAFCTGSEGVDGKSHVYVRSLDAIWSDYSLTKLDMDGAAIPRWRVLDSGDTVIVFVTSAANNKDDASFKMQSTWQVRFSNGSFVGVPQKLFDGAYHGGVSGDNRLAVTGASKLRARIADSTGTARDMVWYGGEQACNASLARDGSKRTLFLDFGGSMGREFVGQNYGTHERLLIADSTGQLIESIGAPAGFSFDHTEWAHDATMRPDERFVVTSISNPEGRHGWVVLVDVSDSSMIELVEGEEIWHPTLWTQEPGSALQTDLDLDSAGAYCALGAGEPPYMLRYKLELLWTYKDTANVVILGSSRPLMGLVPALFSSDLFVINMANVPNMVYVSKYLFENYVLPHVKNLKYLIVSLDIDLWFHSERSDYNFFYNEYKMYPGYVYDANHSFWQDEYPKGLAEVVQSSFGSEYYAGYFRDEMGYVRFSPKPWEDLPVVEYDSTWMSFASDSYYESLARLEELIELAESRGIYVVGIVFPQNPNFQKTGSFGRYGPRRSEAPALLQGIADLSKSHPNFIFMDENKMGNHDFLGDVCNDKDHLAYTGAVKMTARIDSLLHTLK